MWVDWTRNRADPGTAAPFLSTAHKPVVPLGALTRGARYLGLMAAVLFFGVFAAWSGRAPLSSAAVAHDVVSPDGSRKTIQHLEGGGIDVPSVPPEGA